METSKTCSLGIDALEERIAFIWSEQQPFLGGERYERYETGEDCVVLSIEHTDRSTGPYVIKIPRVVLDTEDIANTFSETERQGSR